MSKHHKSQVVLLTVEDSVIKLWNSHVKVTYAFLKIKNTKVVYEERKKASPKLTKIINAQFLNTYSA